MHDQGKSQIHPKPLSSPCDTQTLVTWVGWGGSAGDQCHLHILEISMVGLGLDLQTPTFQPATPSTCAQASRVNWRQSHCRTFRRANREPQMV